MLFEDAQWADPSSLELLDALIDRLPELPILLIVSFRPDFKAPWTGRAGTSLIALARLGRRDSETQAERVTTDRALSREVLKRIVTQADGVPLFIEELTKAVLEASVDPGAAAGPLAVPATLQASLMARLDRLAAARQVAQIGAVIGREFSHALLAASALLPEAQLARGLEELTASGLALRRGALPDAAYTFNHALTRDVAYAGMLKGRRQICHHRIATVLKNFDDGYIEATEPELLAHHFQEAEDLSAAFAYWILAGDVAERHGANQEAVAHYRCAQRLSERAKLSATDRARMPELLMKLGNARMQMTGYHSAEALQCYREARDLALALDQQDEAAEAGIRMAPFLFGSCRHRDVIEIGNTILSGDTSRLRPETLVHVWVMMGGANYHAGSFEELLACSEKAVELDDQVNCTHKAPWAAADPAIVARDYVEMVARLMGNFERSLAISEQSMAIALDRGHLFSVVWASVSRVSALRSFGRYAEAVACADRAMEICEKYGFEARIGNVLLHRGPVLFDLGDEARGLAHGTPLRPRDLREHACLGYAHLASGETWRFTDPEGAEEAVAVTGPLCATNAEALSSALEAWLGTALQPDFLVWDAVQEGRLVTVSDEWAAPKLALRLVTPPGGPRPIRVAVLLEFLTQRFTSGLAPWTAVAPTMKRA